MKKFFERGKIFAPRFLFIQSWYDFVSTTPVGLKVNRIVSHPLVLGSSTIFLGSLLGNIFNFLFNLFMSRNLSFSDYGVIASLFSLMMLFALPVGAMIPMIIYFSATYFAKGDLDMVRGLYKKVTKFSFVIGVSIFTAFFAFRDQIAHFFQIEQSFYIVLVGLSILLAFTSVTNQPLLQAKLAFRFIAFINSLSALLKLILGILFVFLGFSVGGVLWALIIASVIPYFLSFFQLKFLFHRNAMIPAFSLKEILFYGTPAALSTFGLTSLITFDIVLVKHFFSPTDAGVYAILSLIGKVIYYFSAPIASVMFPLIVQKHAKGENYQSDLKLALFLVFLPSLSMVIFYMLFPGFVVAFFSRKALADSVVTLVIPFAILMSFYSLLSVLTNFYLSINKVKIFIPIIIASMSQVILIWIFHGTFLQVIFISLGIASLLLISLLLYYWKLYGNEAKK